MVGQKVHLGFSIKCYGKTQMNFLPNPVLSSVYGWDKGLENFLPHGHTAHLQFYPISPSPTLPGG